jgi:hypothetical protein
VQPQFTSRTQGFIGIIKKTLKINAVSEDIPVFRAIVALWARKRAPQDDKRLSTARACPQAYEMNSGTGNPSC